MLEAAMLAVIDNYDSFTYNLIQYLGMLNVDFRLFRNDELSPEELAGLPVSGLLISPGPGCPKDAGYSIDMVRYFAGRIPVLGVCLGHQVIAEAFGGEIGRAPTPVHGKVSVIEHDKKGLYNGLPNPLQVTRYHSLMITSMPKDFLVTGKTVEQGLIMSIRHKALPVYGVQFHPEAIKTECGLELLGNFVRIVNEKNA